VYCSSGTGGCERSECLLLLVVVEVDRLVKQGVLRYTWSDLPHSHVSAS
jgi:hypothetical protein